MIEYDKVKKAWHFMLLDGKRVDVLYNVTFNKKFFLFKKKKIYNTLKEFVEVKKKNDKDYILVHTHNIPTYKQVVQGNKNIVILLLPLI
jgi:hypothetical protein